MKLIVFDLDGTLWDHEDASQLSPPLRRISEDVIVDSKGERLQLHPNVRRVLSKLRERRDLILAVASWNKADKVKPILELLGIKEYFDYIVIEFTDRKDLMIKRIMKQIEKDKSIRLSPEDIIYIDDREVHINDIRRAIGNVIFIKMWHDVKSFDELSERILEIILQ